MSNHVANEMYNNYPKGVYVWLHKRGRIKHPKEISRYLGRYVCHQVIANSRVDKFGGNFVKFHYVDDEDEKINVTMYVFDFIKALIYPFCKNELQFVIYLSKLPPEPKKIQQELTTLIKYGLLKICHRW